MRPPIVGNLFALSVRSMNQSRARTLLTCGLIATAALTVSCAGGAAASMMAAVTGVASGGSPYQAWISARCAGCTLLAGECGGTRNFARCVQCFQATQH